MSDFEPVLKPIVVGDEFLEVFRNYDWGTLDPTIFMFPLPAERGVKTYSLENQGKFLIKAEVTVEEVANKVNELTQGV